jgi:hypothetical protein
MTGGRHKEMQNHGMNRRRGVAVFEVVSHSPRLGYARRSSLESNVDGSMGRRCLLG